MPTSISSRPFRRPRLLPLFRVALAALVAVLVSPFALTETFLPGLLAQESGSFDPRRIRWSRLEFEARKLIFTARSVIDLRAVASREAASEWTPTSRGRPVTPSGPEVFEVRIESSGLGSESTNTVWFNARHAEALQRTKMRHGGKAYRKAVRFTETGTFMLRTEPVGEAEAALPFSEWSKAQEYFYLHPDLGPCRGVSEPSVLFYMLSARVADGPVQACVFSGKKVVPVKLESAGTERLQVDYAEKARKKIQRRGGQVEALRILIRPLAGAEEFELLGLEGEVEILMEKTLRIPLEVRGRIGGVGRVKVRLTAVELDRS